MEQLYRWVKASERLPDETRCLKWLSPMNNEWVYSSSQSFRNDFMLEKNMEWLSPIEESEQDELWKDISFKITCGDDISELSKQYHLIKK